MKKEGPVWCYTGPSFLIAGTGKQQVLWVLPNLFFGFSALCKTGIQRGGSTQSQIAGDRQDQDAALGHCERQPNLIVESAHSHFSTPQNLPTSNSSSEGIIAENAVLLQEENGRVQYKSLFCNVLRRFDSLKSSRILDGNSFGGSVFRNKFSRVIGFCAVLREEQAAYGPISRSPNHLPGRCESAVFVQMLFLLTQSRRGSILQSVTGLSGRREGATQRGPHKSRSNPKYDRIGVCGTRTAARRMQ